MKLLTIIFASFALLVSAQHQISTLEEYTAKLNKAVVLDFMYTAFMQRQVKLAFDMYTTSSYTQHNPNIADGKQATVDFLSSLVAQFPQGQLLIKRVAADQDLVWVHSHMKANATDLGSALVDIFRVNNGHIVEHWDIVQSVPAKSQNNNTMF